LISWDQAVDTIVTVLKPLKDSNRTNRIGVIASAQLTNEDLFVIRKFFKETLKGAQWILGCLKSPGTAMIFLLKQTRIPIQQVHKFLQPDVTRHRSSKKPSW
jgi:hypothetical protein